MHKLANKKIRLLAQFKLPKAHCTKLVPHKRLSAPPLRMRYLPQSFFLSMSFHPLVILSHPFTIRGNLQPKVHLFCKGQAIFFILRLYVGNEHGTDQSLIYLFTNKTISEQKKMHLHYLPVLASTYSRIEARTEI